MGENGSVLSFKVNNSFILIRKYGAFISSYYLLNMENVDYHV